MIWLPWIKRRLTFSITFVPESSRASTPGTPLKLRKADREIERMKTLSPL